MKVEVAVHGSPSLIVLNNSGLCGRKATINYTVQSSGAVCESRGGRLGLPVLNMVSVDVKQQLTTPCRAQELCVKVEVAVLGSLSLIIMVSVDVKQQLTTPCRAQELCVKVEVAVLGSLSLIWSLWT